MGFVKFGLIFNPKIKQINNFLVISGSSQFFLLIGKFFSENWLTLFDQFVTMYGFPCRQKTLDIIINYVEVINQLFLNININVSGRI